MSNICYSLMWHQKLHKELSNIGWNTRISTHMHKNTHEQQGFNQLEVIRMKGTISPAQDWDSTWFLLRQTQERRNQRGKCCTYYIKSIRAEYIKGDIWYCITFTSLTLLYLLPIVPISIVMTETIRDLVFRGFYGTIPFQRKPSELTIFSKVSHVEFG